jgi:hypothetical protein
MHLTISTLLVFSLYGIYGYRSRCPGCDSQLYQIYLKVMGLKLGPLGYMRIMEEPLERKIINFSLENVD